MKLFRLASCTTVLAATAPAFLLPLRIQGDPGIGQRLGAIEARLASLEERLGALEQRAPATPTSQPSATRPAEREPVAEVLVGSRSSDKYHRPGCSAARRISPANLRTFSSPAEAQRAGYAPCGLCRPPS